MSQADLNIANISRSLFRAEVNDSLQALASCSSGASEPTTTYAFQLWADTTTSTLKQRNSTNDGWVTLGNLGSTFLDSSDIGTTIQAYDADIPTIAASQAEMETGTETALRSMSPLRVAQAISALSTSYTDSDALSLFNASGSAPVYACRAWVNFNGTGTVAIRASGNVSSITDNGTGNYTVNFTNAMPDANYCVSQYLGTTYQRGGYAPVYSASSYRFIHLNDTNGAADDDPDCNVAIFR